MTEPIHPLAIANDDRHDVCCRCSGIKPETAKLRVEVIGVLPKFSAQFWLARAELKGFENCRDHNRRQRTGVNVWMRIKAQILQRLLRTCDKSSQSAKGFRKCAINERNPVLHVKFLSRATTMFATSQHGVGLVNKNARSMGFCDVN